MSRLPRAERGEFVLAVCGPSSAVHCRRLLRQRLAMIGKYLRRFGRQHKQKAEQDDEFADHHTVSLPGAEKWHVERS